MGGDAISAINQINYRDSLVFRAVWKWKEHPAQPGALGLGAMASPTMDDGRDGLPDHACELCLFPACSASRRYCVLIESTEPSQNSTPWYEYCFVIIGIDPIYRVVLQVTCVAASLAVNRFPQVLT